MQDIMAFKLINNMDIIANIEKEDDNAFQTKSPLLVIMQHGNSPGEVSLEFVPVSPLADRDSSESVPIYKNSIISTYKPISQVENMYIEQTSGISIATPSQQASTIKASNNFHTVPLNK